MWNDQYSEVVCTSLIPWNPSRSRTTTTSLNSQGTNTQKKKTIFKKFLVCSCHYLETHDEKKSKTMSRKNKRKTKKKYKK